MGNQLSNRIGKIEQKLSVEEEPFFDEKAFDSWFEWFKSLGYRVTAESKESFLNSCREQGINNGIELIKQIRKEVNGKSLGLPRDQL